MALEGAGTKENPYLINNVDDLIYLRDNMVYQNAVHYLQTADIDLIDYPNFQPIGSWHTYPFRGQYDGGGFTIRNHTYTSTNTAETVGLFGGLEGTSSYYAAVRNLKLENSNLKGYSALGALVGYATEVAIIRDNMIENCHVENLINSATGALVGMAGGGWTSMSYRSPEVLYNKALNCSSKSATNDSQAGQCGALIGRIHSAYVKQNEVRNCSARGANVGGLAGSSNRNAEIYANLIVDCDLTATYKCGGLLGTVWNNYYNYIEDNIVLIDKLKRLNSSSTVFGDLYGDSAYYSQRNATIGNIVQQGMTLVDVTN